MMYTLVLQPKVKKQLAKLDKHTRRMIEAWIDKHISACENPRVYGKALTANRKGEWRYRIGDYRLICAIEDDKLVIIALALGHRRQIYD